MLKKGCGWTYRLFSSRELTIGLFIPLCLTLMITSFVLKENPFLWGFVRALLVVIAANLCLCTLKRIKSISRAVLIIHIGIIVTLIGSGISSSGFVATVNVYEGTMVNKAYRWDIKQDVALGMDLEVKEIHQEYYPIHVKVGVLRDDEKAGLFILKTGESFNLENYTVRADKLDLPVLNLKLSVFSNGNHIGDADTLGNRDLPADFPFEFKLVAYGNPVLKRTWVDLRISKGAEMLAEGSAEVNSQFRWEELNFYHTQTGWDKYGNRYAGIQITKDPGKPYVFSGFGMIALGALFYFFKKPPGMRI